MKYDVTKTQFLVDPGPVLSTIRAFRRKRGYMLFSKVGQPMRSITWAQWEKMRREWPAEVAADGLSVKQVWFLVEIKGEADA